MRLRTSHPSTDLNNRLTHAGWLLPSFLAVFLLTDTAAADDFLFSHEQVLGTTLELTITCADQHTAQLAERRALQEIDRLAAIFSSYQTDSQFSQFCGLPAGQSMPAAPELLRLLKRCEDWTRVSAGAFNPAIDVISRRWRQASVDGVEPSAAELQQLVSMASQKHWQCQVEQGRLVRRSEQPLTLNAIAKGSIIDSVVLCLQSEFPQIDGLVVNIGGDLRAAGANDCMVTIPVPARDALNAAPLAVLQLSDRAIATSGMSERSWNVAGRLVSHILDPRTATPCVHVPSASVLAADAETADVLATICSVLKPAESVRLIESIPGAACCLVTEGGAVLCSAGWPLQESAGQTTDEKPPVGTAGSAAKSPFELTVDFEIAKAAGGGRYRRPYVAVWVEDSDGFPVKTLSLFLMADNPGPRWHRDLRRWYSSDQVRQLVDDAKLIGTISKPTRNPGMYKVAWDGRDDKGDLLQKGKYTLYIEAAREHGSYQLIRHAFELGGADFNEQLKGNTEISAASIRYTGK
ncbi:MAG: DUF2271 domain-containing protein [Planctomycetaceae bacterium]